MSESYDAIVIGTGQAGPALAVRLAKTGRKTAIIERKRFGGTCVNNGCIPTKALIASARAAHRRRRSYEGHRLHAIGHQRAVAGGLRRHAPADRARTLDASVRGTRWRYHPRRPDGVMELPHPARPTA